MQQDVLEQHYEIRDSQYCKLKVEPSTLPQAGMGLFAREDMSRGEYICEYYGSVATAQQSESEVFNNEDKMAQVDEQICLISRSIASRANDIIDFNPSHYLSNKFSEYLLAKQFPVLPSKSHNAKLSVQSKQKVFIKAKRDISAGEQIFIDYGFSYWRFFYESLGKA